MGSAVTFGGLVWLGIAAMTEAILCLGLGLAGAVVGAFASRVRASGSIAVLLALLPGAGLWVASGSN